jgi:hypothetical protein
LPPFSSPSSLSSLFPSFTPSLILPPPSFSFLPDFSGKLDLDDLEEFQEAIAPSRKKNSRPYGSQSPTRDEAGEREGKEKDDGKEKEGKEGKDKEEGKGKGHEDDGRREGRGRVEEEDEIDPLAVPLLSSWIENQKR